MKKVEYTIGGRIMPTHDAAIVMPDEDPLEALIEAARQAVSTDIEITCGGVTMHLAAWEDPDHWGEDWAEKGIDPGDVSGLVAEAVAE